MIGKLPIIDRELLASGVFLRSEFQARQAGENGFIACDETFAIYGRDVPEALQLAFSNRRWSCADAHNCAVTSRSHFNLLDKSRVGNMPQLEQFG